MKIQTRAVHAGDRKRAQRQIPVATPIHTAASFITEDTAELDRIFADEEKGFAYQRYTNPTNEALEELVTSLENGRGSLATASGMAALQLAVTAAVMDRRRVVFCARDIYGATIKLLLDVMAPFGLEVRFVDVCDLEGLGEEINREKPGCILMETISNPLLRVAAIDEIAKLANQAGAALVVDNTFATPLLVRPLELGAHLVVHSATKYLGGHGDVLGGLITTDEEHFELVRRLSRVVGPVLGPFESYLTMRGIKTFPLRMERQCANAARLAEWLAGRPEVERVFFPGDPAHPDHEVIGRLLPPGLRGAMVSFELRGAGREAVFAFLDRLRLVVKATSLGDVHTMILYPWISSHRDVPLRQKERMGIRENLVRVSLGIEDFDDIAADFAQALAV
jgi:cystathionine gamma-synthase/methionine-gamma-lyase